MKIKDIVAEGVLDFAKGLWNTGSIEGAKAASQQATGEKDLLALAKNVIGKWNVYYGQTKDTNIAKWATGFFGRDVSSISPPNVADAKDVNDYLTTVTRAYRANQLVPIGGSGKQYKPRQSAITPIQPVAPQTPASAPAGTIGALGKRGATAPAQPQAYQSPMGVTVRQANDAGIVLGYRNRNYMLNDDGQWALEGKTAVSGQLDAEMDKVAKSTGYM
jgi:hypothetical protein